MKSQGFPKYRRLLKREDFKRLNREECYRIDEYFYFFWQKNGLKYQRLGISINKKLARAIKRNRIRRLIKEAFRLNDSKMLLGFDLLIIVRKNAISLSFSNIQEQLDQIYHYIN